MTHLLLFWAGFFKVGLPQKKPTGFFGYVPGCPNPGVITSQRQNTYQDSYDVKIFRRSGIVAALKLELGEPVQCVQHLHLELLATIHTSTFSPTMILHDIQLHLHVQFYRKKTFSLRVTYVGGLRQQIV